MTKDQQGTGESIFSFGYMLRMVQLFDFELANAVYNGAFHLGGLLPVIPGPCGLYITLDVSGVDASTVIDNVTFLFGTDFATSVSVVPVPAAAWMGLSLLGGMGIVRKIRTRCLEA